MRENSPGDLTIAELCGELERTRARLAEWKQQRRQACVDANSPWIENAQSISHHIEMLEREVADLNWKIFVREREIEKEQRLLRRRSFGWFVRRR